MPDASLDKPPLPTRLADYRPPDFLIDEVALDFDLGDTETLVKSHLQLRRNPEAATAAAPLRLDGEELALLAISLDGKPLAPGDYALEPDGTLGIPNVPDAFAPRSGRNVPLAIWVRRGDEDKCGHAMASLKKSMRWDEETFGLEYDLDVFNIVAVSDFNMGAMENKGLNVFNTRYVLAKPDTATDNDYEDRKSVV